MSEISDEVLMAYVDGALDEKERAQVLAMITARPDLQARIAMFTSTGKALGAPFAKLAHEAPPQRLLDAAMGKPAARRPAASAAMPMRRAPRSGGWSGWLSTGGVAPALARAAALLLVGAGIGWYATKAASPNAPYALEDGRLLARGALARALETSPSGSGPHSTGAPVIRLSFKGPEGFCRHYQIEIARGHGLAGLACRGSDTHWRVVAHTSVAIAPAANGTQPAGGADTSLIESTLDGLMDGDPLGADEERMLIARHWQH